MNHPPAIHYTQLSDKQRPTKDEPVVFGFWANPDGDFLHHEDISRPVAVGVVHSVKGRIVICDNGLHVANDLSLNELFGNWSPGDVYLVAVWGTIRKRYGKACGRHRLYLAKINMRVDRDCVRSVITKKVLAKYVQWFDRNIRR
jgi:hypothetical protein